MQPVMMDSTCKGSSIVAAPSACMHSQCYRNRYACTLKCHCGAADPSRRAMAKHLAIAATTLGCDMTKMQLTCTQKQDTSWPAVLEAVQAEHPSSSPQLHVPMYT